MSQHKPRKRFGQHFLHDMGVITRIIRAVNPQPGELLVEIGPGQGAITKHLLQACGKLHVVEIDRDLVTPLQDQLGSLGELHVHLADALKFDYCSLADGNMLRLVGNLPYNISTPLLFHILAQSHCVQDMHFMLQKEVVDRMVASPGSDAYGRLSVMIQYYCEVEALFDIGRGAFNPPPKVESSVIRLIPYASRPRVAKDERSLSELVNNAFSQRRKTLRNSLKNLLAGQDIEACGIDPSLRAERLGLAEFIALSDRLYEKRQETN